MIIKPILFTIVSAVPLDIAGEFCATNVENKGESATTTIPQKIRKLRNENEEAYTSIMGETRQQIPESSKEIPAIFLTPNFSER